MNQYCSNIVLLGFIDQAIKDESTIDWFTNKIGGNPVFPSNIDDRLLSSIVQNHLICPNCSSLSAFICQIQCQVDDNQVYRVIYVFACHRDQCKHYVALRLISPPTESRINSNSSSRNLWEQDDNWSNDEEENKDEWNPECQPKDDEEARDDNCRTQSDPGKMLTTHLGSFNTFKPFYVYVEDEKQLRDGLKNQLIKETTINLNDDGEDNQMMTSGEDGEKYENIEIETIFSNDKASYKFYKRLREIPEQLIRYSWQGEPLVNRCNVDLNCDDCEQCGSKRCFEFQLMPGLITQLKPSSQPYSLDFGTILIYTCSENCAQNNIKIEKCFFLEDVDNNLIDEYISKA